MTTRLAIGTAAAAALLGVSCHQELPDNTLRVSGHSLAGRTASQRMPRPHTVVRPREPRAWADRAPDGVYKTMNLAGIFIRENGLFMNPANKGRYYHDGRFATLLDVVNHYNTRFSLGLTAQDEGVG